MRALRLLSLAVLLAWMRPSDLPAALNVEWDAQSSAQYLYDSLGIALPSSTDYLIQLVVDTGNNTVFSQLLAGYVGIGHEADAQPSIFAVDASATDDYVVSDLDVPWASSVWTDAGGGTSYAPSQTSDTTPWNSKRLYVRWFNSSSYATATEVGIIYSTAGSYAWVSPADGTSPNEVFAYDYGTTDVGGSEYTAGANDGWQTIAPVPEPGTMGLMAVGLAAVALRRKFRKA